MKFTLPILFVFLFSINLSAQETCPCSANPAVVEARSYYGFMIGTFEENPTEYNEYLLAYAKISLAVSTEYCLIQCSGDSIPISAEDCKELYDKWYGYWLEDLEDSLYFDTLNDYLIERLRNLFGCDI